MYLEIRKETITHYLYTILPVTCKEEAEEIINIIKKYHTEETFSFVLNDKGEILNQYAYNKKN